MLENESMQYPAVLVTGSTGFLGSRIVEILMVSGFKVRAFARKTSKLDKLKSLGVEVCIGDITDINSLSVAFEGMDYIVHAAADTLGIIDGGKSSTIQGTKNILKLCKERRIKKLVYISSCNVYGVSSFEDGYMVTEDSPLERMPGARGAYSNAKFQAEKLVLQAITENICPIVCLRPGTIYGPGGEIYTPMMGFSMGRKVFLTINNVRFILPLVYIDNVVDAVRVVLKKNMSNGNVYNLIDPYQLTKKQYIKILINKIYSKAIFLDFPYTLLYITVILYEFFMKIIGKEPFLTRYRLESSQKKVIYNGNKICRELAWDPPVSLNDALNNVIEYEKQRIN
jgi:2-alkyl-3-oxoalkanoate reductase